uniref:Uncharacterized protein n=1 Tax=viral metagenome TaxID=1070528 RepID=A0A6M3LW84_9ZZZZ
MRKFDSKDEMYFQWYLEELVKDGEVEKFYFQHPVFHICESKSYTKAANGKGKKYTLLREHDYTADFMIVWSELAKERYTTVLSEDKCIVYPRNFFTSQILPNSEGKLVSVIEIKPKFDRYNMTRLFKINQKIVYNLYNVYVQEVNYLTVFKNTFVPQRYLLTDSNKHKRKINFNYVEKSRY